jgi:hypothetical protein
MRTLHLRVSEAALRYNSPDCPVCHRTDRCTSVATAPRAMVDCNGHLQKCYSARTVRVESEQPLEGTPDCLVPHEDKALTVETVRTLTVR